MHEEVLRRPAWQLAGQLAGSQRHAEATDSSAEHDDCGHALEHAAALQPLGILEGFAASLKES